MARWISFIVLAAVVVFFAAIFLRVMAEFIVPLFVALVLVVIFRPLHVWILSKMPQRPAVAAFITTATVSLLVFLPVVIMFVMAAAEGREIVKRFDRAVLLQKFADFREGLGLNVPHAGELLALEREWQGVRRHVESMELTSGFPRLRDLDTQQRDLLRSMFRQIEIESQDLGRLHGLKWPEPVVPSMPQATNLPVPRRAEDLPRGKGWKASTATYVRWVPGPESCEQDQASELASGADQNTNVQADAVVEQSQDVAEDPIGPDEQQQESFFGLTLPGFGNTDEIEDRPVRAVGASILEQQWFNYAYQLQDTLQLLEFPASSSDEEQESAEWLLPSQLGQCVADFREFKVRLLGGPLMAWLRETANPQQEELEEYTTGLLDFAKRNFVSWGSVVSFYLGRLVFGVVIIMAALYFFLLDGPKMVRAICEVSPLDDRHEQELIAEFDRTSRAVVVATLAAAIVQGLLAGLGFYIAGIESVFLLTMLTMLLAMIPFLGAASVWFPVVVYVALFENRPVAAGLLFLYCALIVSTIDNIIKPYILHGQSNLHPLLALLSVLGGVTALGPIGILLGPMLVVFLQTLLKLLKAELMSLDYHRPPVSTDEV